MKLKGRARLTIKNEDGSIAYREEHTNAITPALAAIFNNNIAGTVDFTKVTPILNKLLGGVCLWNGTLNENDIFLPKQNNAVLVAHAGQNAYSSASDDPTRGLPNDEAEGYGDVENGFCFVWEWGTSQGNGQITGLSLCHADVGDYYNQLHKSTGMTFCPVDDISNYLLNSNNIVYSDSSPSVAQEPALVGVRKQVTESGQTVYKSNDIPIGFYDDLNHVVTVDLIEDGEGAGEGGGDYRTGHININICKFTGDGLWLWNNVGDVKVERTISVTPLWWQWGNFEALGRGIFYIVYDEEIKHLYIISIGHRNMPEDPPTQIYNVKWLPMEMGLTYRDVDLETGTVTTKTIDLYDGSQGNDQPQLVVRTNEEPYEPIFMHAIGGCIILPVYRINWVSTGVDEGYYDYGNVDTIASAGVRINLRGAQVLDYVDGGMAYEGSNGRSYTSQVDLGNGRSMLPNAFFERRPSSTTITDPAGRSQTSFFYCDPIPRTTTIFGTDYRSNRAYFASKSDSLIQYATLVKTAGAGNIRGAILNKMYQASVFRLTRAVTKTVGQTMTVEYTITQEVEET